MEMRPVLAAALSAAALAMLLAGCVGPFDTSDYSEQYLHLEPAPEQYREIESMRLEDESSAPPVSVEEAAKKIDAQVIEDVLLRDPDPPTTVTLTVQEVRAAALESNLDLQVELYNPSIAQAGVDAEEAKFEWVFQGSFTHSKIDAPQALATEGSEVDFESVDLALIAPLRTGGTVRLGVPFSETNTDNIFATLNPSYDAAAALSISQPLLRNAGNLVNTHSIRVVGYQADITTAQTKLAAIRILADADRSYWILYAVTRELEVARKNYELAARQLEQARNRYNAGIVAEVEIIRAQSGVAQRLQAIIVALNAVRLRERDLKRIMNLPDLPMTSTTRLALASEPQPVGLELDALRLADFAVENRMEMLELELQLAIDASTIDFRKNQTLPLITLDYRYSFDGLGATLGDAFDQVGTTNYGNWTFGVSGEIPIGNEQAESLLRQAILQRVQRLATKEQRQVAIRNEVLDAVDSLRQNWQRILAARLDTVLSARTYEAEVNQFQQGVRTSTDVLDAASRLAQAQSSEILALTDYQISQIDLAFATGTLIGYGKVLIEPREE